VDFVSEVLDHTQIIFVHTQSILVFEIWCHLQLLDEYREKQIDILYKHQDALSVYKNDLGVVKNLTHKIHLKSNDPLYRKQFKIPEVWKAFSSSLLGTDHGCLDRWRN
jgi:hypothetical protein